MKRKIFRWILIILWCMFIFYQSDKPADQSKASSGFFTTAVNNLIEKTVGNDALTISENFIRKTAHFIEYMILGILLFNAVKTLGNRSKYLVVSTLAGALYAVTDEIHQYFVPGRAMRYCDVFIDTAGVLTGVLLVYIVSARKVK